jgi:hypothetical protein
VKQQFQSVEATVGQAPDSVDGGEVLFDIAVDETPEG